jgi:glyoxylase-like metal-dependent hydrolase (beta-lactamase superfamily II)
VNIYEVNKVSDHLIIFGERLSDWAINAMALIIGKNKAALIDTGMGITGDLDQFVRKYTDLPVIVLLTHGDPDHVGAASLFRHVYMSKMDGELLPGSLSLKTRLGDLGVMTNGNNDICEYAKTHIVGEDFFVYQNIENGDTFDLGNISIEAIAVPGHTKGSMCFINRKDKYVLTGDSINTFVWLWLERCTTIYEYIESLKHFRKETKGITEIYCGHRITPLPIKLVDDLIAAGNEIIEGKSQNDLPYKVPYDIDSSGVKAMRHGYGIYTIIYNQYRIK